MIVPLYLQGVWNEYSESCENWRCNRRILRIVLELTINQIDDHIPKQIAEEDFQVRAEGAHTA